MAETRFDEWMAQRYETLWPELFDPAVLDPAVSFLAELAGGGPALEFGAGTGRVALPLRRRGVPVHGIELSPAMAARLRAAGGPDVRVTVGDMATTRLDTTFRLVYLLRNTITNLTSQEEQVAVFGNAAAHLEPGGRFVVENYVPQLRRLPPGQSSHLFAATPTHIGVEEYDFVAQIAVSRHWWIVDGEVKEFSSPHRYVWPAELDLMARMAGLRLRERWAGWHREPFTADSPSHISVWEAGGAAGPTPAAGPRPP
jgi:SAM-dependent methyltransferase